MSSKFETLGGELDEKRKTCIYVIGGGGTLMGVPSSVL